jgi:hypothetical protein
MIVSTVMPFIAPRLGWSSGYGRDMIGGGHMFGGGMMGGFGMPFFGFGMFLWPLLIIGLIVFGVSWLARSNAPQPQAACSHCGKPLQLGWKACPHCGEKL